MSFYFIITYYYKNFFNSTRFKILYQGPITVYPFPDICSALLTFHNFLPPFLFLLVTITRISFIIIHDSLTTILSNQYKPFLSLAVLVVVNVFSLNNLCLRIGILQKFGTLIKKNIRLYIIRYTLQYNQQVIHRSPKITST